MYHHKNPNNQTKLKICMVSDFFYPALGGIETHIFCLSQELIKKGHKVIVITGGIYKNRQGVRYMTNGLKVYYLPSESVYEKRTVGTMAFSLIQFVRNILLREKIDIVHAHQYSSTLGLEITAYASLIGKKTVLTCHSLFSDNSLGSLYLNAICKFHFSLIDCCICVSNTCKENFFLNIKLNPKEIYVIPNGLESERFIPNPNKSPDPSKKIIVVVICRMVFRKGIELIAQIIPEICSEFKKVDFIVVGDGNKKILINEVRKKYRLEKRIKILGSVPYNKVRDILIKGHIFLNCSLTESFCMAIIEAISCGLKVVSTNVGGIPEIVPERMVTLCDPEKEKMIIGLRKAIFKVNHNPWENHKEVKSIYSWKNVAERTEKIYLKILKKPFKTYYDNIRAAKNVGKFSKYFYITFLLLLITIEFLLDLIYPIENIDNAIDLKKNLKNDQI